VKTDAPQPKPARLWQKTPFSNLIRYVPSGGYFARLRIRGKLIRKTLKTDVLSVAKLRLADFEKAERSAAERQEGATTGRMTFGAALETYLRQTAASSLLKPSAKSYREEVVKAISKTWPDLEELDVRSVSQTECKSWAARLSTQYSPTRYNATIGVLRQILNVAVDAGALCQNPASLLKRARIRPKTLQLPDQEKFKSFVTELENGGGRDSQNCADLVRFLAFGGFRISEAAHVTWGDCDFLKGEIVVRGDASTGTKNWTIRRVPMISDMRQLLERLKSERTAEPPETPVMRVRECQKAMDRAAKVVGMPRITHHDLRHLFATRCIESGVDVPTVSRWLGHKDGGALAMKTYGHLRDEHSANMANKVKF
jgi:integrase